MQNTIYIVEELTYERPFLIGYFTGNPVDIKRYFMDKNSYREVSLNPIEYKHISPQMANERETLLLEKVKLEKRLKEIDRIL